MAGGGAATNSGIDFQQRVGAYVMAQVLTGRTDYRMLSLDADCEVRALRFETQHAVDDLVLETTAGRVFIQAKRTLFVSGAIKSEFSSVLAQFVAQYCDNPQDDDAYVIATSSDASKSIRQELRKLTEAARLNPSGWADNPLTKPERHVLETTLKLTEDHYRAITQRPLSDEDAQAIFRRIHVSVTDIEAGGRHEDAVLTSLAARNAVDPALVWGCLISACLDLAKNRLSVDAAAVVERFGQYLDAEGESSARSDTLLELICNGQLPSGRDIVLARMPRDETRMLAVELRRFNEDGSKGLTFRDGRVFLRNGNSFEIVRRASTWTGLSRWIQENPDCLEGLSLYVSDGMADLSADQESFALAHSEWCRQQLLPAPFNCIHCGDSVSEDRAECVELDDAESEPAVGLAHGRCLRPADRILGAIDSALFREHDRLRDFDYDAWRYAIQRGQGGLPEITPGLVAYMLREPDVSGLSRGDWCVQIRLEDGGVQYSTRRGKVERASEAGAKETANQLRQAIDEAGRTRDPWCCTSEAFGTYSALLSTSPAHDRPVPCADAVAVRYSAAIGRAYSRCDNFYAPLALLLCQETGAPLILNGALPLVSNPLELARRVENWEKAHGPLPDFVVSMVVNDDQFDKLAISAASQGHALQIDPIVDLNGNLVSGVVVASLEEFMASQDGSA